MFKRFLDWPEQRELRRRFHKEVRAFNNDELATEFIFRTPEAAVKAWAHLVNTGDIDALEKLYVGMNHFKPTLRDDPVDPTTESRKYFEELGAKKVIMDADAMAVCIGTNHATVTGPYIFEIKAADGKIKETHAEFRFDLMRQKNGWRIMQHRSNLLPKDACASVVQHSGLFAGYSVS